VGGGGSDNDNDNDTTSTSPPEIPTVAGQLVVSEVMINPADQTDATGEWFEIHNPGINSFNLKDCTLSDTGSDIHLIANDLIIGPSTYITLAISTGVPFTPNYDYSGGTFLLGNNGDEINLVCGGITIDSITWDNGATFPVAAGSSMSLDPNTLDSVQNDSEANWCLATSFIGTLDKGTPGAVNDACP
jgi:hypothetical protein